MTALAGPLFIACLVLATGGAAKAVRPLPTRRALYALGLPSAAPLVRALGVVEVVLAAVTIVVGGLTPVAVGAVYMAFAAFVAVARRNGSVGSCGCFGRSDTPPTQLHIGLNLGAAAAAFAATGTDGIAAVVSDQPALGLPFLTFVGVGTYAVLLAFVALPRLQVASAIR